ncbi:MAG TPA: 6-carboxytetrahydropterin synthase [Bryobacteraceae bacterium]|nr:6-carboxytetrahydropterin synthase [Bryobacteraceae bacterium]
MTRVTRRYHFAASHRLYSSRFSEQENWELYGKCTNPYGHGHDYILDITVAGPVDAFSGQVVNVRVLDELVDAKILRDFDHRYLNADIGEFRETVPTSENIIRVMQDRLRSQWHTAFPGEWPRLENIKLRETRRNLFELRAS